MQIDLHSENVEKCSFDGYFDLVPTKHKQPRAQGNIFGILVSKAIYIQTKTGVLDDSFAYELSTTLQVEIYVKTS